LKGRGRLFQSGFFPSPQTTERCFFVFFLGLNGGRFLSDALEKDRDTLTDKINNGIITMGKKVEDAFAFRMKTFEKMRSVSA